MSGFPGAAESVAAGLRGLHAVTSASVTSSTPTAIWIGFIARAYKVVWFRWRVWRADRINHGLFHP